MHTDTVSSKMGGMESTRTRESIKFFLPDSNDLVDPDFDFPRDSYSSARTKGLKKDVYAHQIFGNPNCDGLLVSKSNVDRAREEEIIGCGGIRSFYRFPHPGLIMGDCGAFQFIGKSEPPYSNEEIYSYYQRLGFDLGISLDHVIVEFNEQYDVSRSLFPLSPTETMQYRFRLSLDNAKALLKMTRTRGGSFKPVGCVQGWSPESYHIAVKELIDAGYDYIAIGGVAKAPNEVIYSILNRIRRTVLNANTRLHVLGVARLNVLDEYLKTNVASCDSAASLMQAFKSTKDNYYSNCRNYTAVRIPAVDGDASPKVLKHLKPLKDNTTKYEREKSRLRSLEHNALKTLRSYAERKCSLAKAMRALKDYEDQFEGEAAFYPMFEDTLRDRPWESCPCAVCQKIGVEVVVMRGNNRNRRRGFHNTFVFFEQFKRKVGSS